MVLLDCKVNISELWYFEEWFRKEHVKKRIYLLQKVLLEASSPKRHGHFQFVGIGPIPSSLKLLDSGQTPAQEEDGV